MEVGAWVQVWLRKKKFKIVPTQFYTGTDIMG